MLRIRSRRDASEGTRPLPEQGLDAAFLQPLDAHRAEEPPRLLWLRPRVATVARAGRGERANDAPPHPAPPHRTHTRASRMSHKQSTAAVAAAHPAACSWRWLAMTRFAACRLPRVPHPTAYAANPYGSCCSCSRPGLRRGVWPAAGSRVHRGWRRPKSGQAKHGALRRPAACPPSRCAACQEDLSQPVRPRAGRTGPSQHAAAPRPGPPSALAPHPCSYDYHRTAFSRQGSRPHSTDAMVVVIGLATIKHCLESRLRIEGSFEHYSRVSFQGLHFSSVVVAGGLPSSSNRPADGVYPEPRPRPAAAPQGPTHIRPAWPGLACWQPPEG